MSGMLTCSIVIFYIQDESFRNSMAYSLSMATPEGSNFPFLTGELSRRMEKQLEMSKSQIYNAKKTSIPKRLDDRPLPQTVEDALRSSSRAIVITENTRPFRVSDVNKAWENLCGYSYLESKGQSLGDLLKGPETDQLAVTSLLSPLLRGEEATTVLTNYTKTGRKFRNRLQVGPLYNEEGDITHFVGVLQEVQM
jgi:PAS domain S-box-containing protein